MGIWDVLSGKADREERALWAARDKKLEEQAREREQSIPHGYEWVWRSMHDNPMRFPACELCGATVEMPNAEKHTAWHASRS